MDPRRTRVDLRRPRVDPRRASADRARSAASFVRDAGKKRGEIEIERRYGGVWLPGESIVEQCGAFVARMPDFECLRLAVDDPIFGDAVLLEEPSFRDSVVARRARRQNFDGER